MSYPDKKSYVWDSKNPISRGFYAYKAGKYTLKVRFWEKKNSDKHHIKLNVSRYRPKEYPINKTINVSVSNNKFKWIAFPISKSGNYDISLAPYTRAMIYCDSYKNYISGRNYSTNVITWFPKGSYVVIEIRKSQKNKKARHSIKVKFKN